jgi:FkbM family methyltransferase
MDYIEITFEGGGLSFVDTNRLSKKRVDGLFKKEPTTIVWMDSFEPNDVMFDVGANVGMYSVYAGKISGARVYSFEPESQNYAELNRNIFLNQLNERVTAYNLAASNKFEISTLYLSHFCPGYSHHDFGENRWTEDKLLGSQLVKRDERLQQGCVSIKLDDVVREGVFPQPHHIKVDVDGFEWKVIDGARETLSSPQLKTALIETDNSIAESVAIIDIMTSLGWKFSYDQMRVNQHEVMSEQDVKDRIQRGAGGQNIIYFKDDSYFDLFKRYADNFVPPNPLKPKAAA